MQLLISNEQEQAVVGEEIRSLIEQALQEALALESSGSGRQTAGALHVFGPDVSPEAEGAGIEGIGTASPGQSRPEPGDRRPTADTLEVSLVLVDDVRMEFLNRQYRGIAGTTDVLSFSMLEDDGESGPPFPPGEVAAPEAEVLLGDIVISVPKALSQAAGYGNSFPQELVFLAVHGMLHLLGYDDETEPGAALMMERTRQVMERLGLGAGRNA